MKALGAAFFVAVVASSTSGFGAPRRRHFEPDDLQLEAPGILDLDLQLGPVWGNSASGDHVLMPDFEVGLGLTRNVELDVSGTFTIDRENGQRHVTGDSLWVATKLGVFDLIDGTGNVWAVGLELGPRLPTLDAGGIGYGALGLLGWTHRGLALVLNVGSFIDPGASANAGHPTSLLFGLDLNAALDDRGRFSLQSELGFAHYLSTDPDELAYTLGTTYALTGHLDISVMALSGFLPNTDHWGVLLGVSPQLELWRPRDL